MSLPKSTGEDYSPLFLLTWNPDRFEWDDYGEACDALDKGAMCFETSWSVRNKSPRDGDRFLLLLQGRRDKNGIVGAGYFTSMPYEVPVYTDFGVRFADIEFVRMWDYRKVDGYVHTEILKEVFPSQCFVPQFSGIRAKAAVVPELWAMVMRS
jgi:hypothetical protein